MIRLSRRSVLAALAAAPVVGLILPKRAKAADQPHMQAALDLLRNARKELASATSDKGGHRANAIKHVDRAIAEVERGIAFDRRH
ncbi:MAG TPA: hypothetical protein VFV34_26840 [Blastocatellia bacterium]|nr:hypothetical protein [Blastocatellia bacterium]